MRAARLNPTAAAALLAWFGRSRVRTSSGRPRVFYHATRAEFSAFDTTRSDLGSHFGTCEQANNVALSRLAGSGSVHILPVYLRIERPLRLRDIGSFHADGIAIQLEKKGLLPRGEGKRIERECTHNWRLRRHYDPLLRQAIIDAGYDGVVYQNTAPGEGPGDSYIAFCPTQIKSALGNCGRYDPLDGDLLA